MNIKKTKTIGIRTDEHFLKLLESASKMYNASKSEIIRSAVSRTYGIPVINYETIEACQRRTKTAPNAGEKVHHLAGSGRSKTAPACWV